MFGLIFIFLLISVGVFLFSLVFIVKQISNFGSLTRLKVEEQQIVNQIKLGNQNTFEMVFNDFYNPLVNYSCTIVKDQDDAEDVVQQVFINIWNKREGIDKVSSLKNYLYRAVYNSSLNRVKQQAVRRDHLNEQKLTVVPKEEMNLGHKELEQKIEEALDKLPEQCSRVFKMSRFEELKYKEIAERLNISVKTVENHMGKALKLMREMLHEYLPLLLIIISQIDK